MLPFLKNVRWTHSETKGAVNSMANKTFFQDVNWTALGFLIVVLFIVFLVFGSGFKSSLLGAMVYGAGIFWYFSSKARKAAQEEALEKERVEARDADEQDKPYIYRIGRHANETLALRYGLVNSFNDLENDTIKLKKIQLIKEHFYECELPDFGNRTAIAVIEKETEYVKTFYPLSKTWFDENEQLEDLLKNNRGLKLSEVAKYHIDSKLRLTGES